jgi:Tctex-1 family
MDFEGSNEFVPDEIIRVINEAFLKVFGLDTRTESADPQFKDNEIKNEKDRQQIASIVFNKAKVNGWCSALIDSCIKGLIKMNRKFKYVVTCVCHQITGAQMVTYNSCFYDSSTDGQLSRSITINDVYIVITIYALCN